MSWEYRVIELEDPAESVFVIKEVYYDDSDRIEAWSADKMAPMGMGDLDDLKGDLEKMVRALKLPVIKEEQLQVGRPRWI